MKKKTVISIVFLAFLMSASLAFAHCEIPCGIYDDGMRIRQVSEHITTVEKSIKSIMELSTAADKNYNQLVRWITNKETHATQIQHIVTQYFMTQRIKPVSQEHAGKYKKYMEELRLLHEILIYAMKAKQTTDLAHVERLRSLLKSFSFLYFGPEAHQHSHQHD